MLTLRWMWDSLSFQNGEQLFPTMNGYSKSGNSYLKSGNGYLSLLNGCSKLSNSYLKSGIFFLFKYTSFSNKHSQNSNNGASISKNCSPFLNKHSSISKYRISQIPLILFKKNEMKNYKNMGFLEIYLDQYFFSIFNSSNP